MSAKTLERRLARLQAKQRSFDHWSDEELDQAIALFLLAAGGLTPQEEKQIQRYTARMPPIPEEVAAISEEILDQRIWELRADVKLGD